MPGVDISVIIPTYNRLWSLPQTVESCRNTNCNVEIIVIDDGSTDGTLIWLNKQKDINIIQQPYLGKCWAVNSGFEIAKGKYIRFLDSDDLTDKFSNDEQFELAEQSEADVVVSGYQSFNNEGQTINIQTWIKTDDFIAQQLGETDGSHYSAFLFRKDFIKDIPHRPDFAFRDDRLFILEVALKNPKIAFHSGTALLHRIAHNERLQLSSGLKQQVQNYQHLNLYKHILNQLAAEKRLTERRINAAINVLWPLAHWIAQKHLNEALEVVNWIYRLNPDFKIPANGLLGKSYSTIGFYKTEKLLHIRRTIKNWF
ncbi:MAG: hypothetical protein JWQ63_1434 [Mucilaginibacter sp.]|nr:hypothetical protein [Mucilaginibacter sp.]